ncbi:MAG: SDR family oxidoreductase [Planctomycetaceae bacterium]|nr:SDR family oxidoreductase [Planctomycetaceae bacterium]
MIDLTGRVALVTGASRGIGRACAERLAACGADVVVNFLNSRDKAAEVVESVQSTGRTGVAVRADVSEPDDVRALADFVGERFGRLDIVVSNAAAGGFRPLLELSPANWEATMRSNAAPLIWLMQAAAPLLTQQPRSSVVAISSHGSTWAVPNYGAIGASKASLEALVRQFAYELGPQGINFNAVMPGIVDTAAIRTMPGVETILNAVKDRLLIKGDNITPPDVAGIVAFLASEHAAYIQGQTIIADGGVSLHV